MWRDHFPLPSTFSIPCSYPCTALFYLCKPPESSFPYFFTNLSSSLLRYSTIPILGLGKEGLEGRWVSLALQVKFLEKFITVIPRLRDKIDTGGEIPQSPKWENSSLTALTFYSIITYYVLLLIF